MAKTKLVVVSLVLFLLALPVLGACTTEKIVEVPVEKVVEKEVVKEVPVEKVVEKEVVKEVPVDMPVIKIGFNTDLSGPYANVLVPGLEALQAYFRYINEEKGGIDGKAKIEVIWGDTRLEPPKMISLYESCKEQGVVAYHLISTLDNYTLAERLAEDKMPAFSYGSDPPFLVPPGEIYVFYVPYVEQFGIYVDWIIDNWEEERAPKLAFLTMDNPAGRAVLADECLEYAEERGVEIVSTQFLPMVPTDTTTQLTAIKNAEADFTYGVLLSHNAAVAAKDALRLGLKENTVFGAAMPLALDQMGKLAGAEAAEGWIATYGMSMATDTDVPGVQLMHELLQKYYGKEASTDHAYGFVFAVAWVEVIKKALEVVEPEDLTPALLEEKGFQRMKDAETMGLLPPQTWGPTRRCGTDTHWIYEVKDGVPKRIWEGQASGLVPGLFPEE